MQLCGSSLSPFHERIVIGLGLKGGDSPIENAGMPHGFKTPEHLALSPTGKIPYLVKDDGSALIEGQVILEYMDAITDGPDLMSADPATAAQQKLIARVYDLYVIRAMAPVLGALIFQQKDDAAIEKAMSEELPAALDLLDKCLEGAGTRAVGDDWSIADCVLIPMMFQLDNFMTKFGYEGFGERANLNRWWDSIKDTYTVKDSHARMLAGLQAITGQS
jgi:glutathione S-transferase